MPRSIPRHWLVLAIATGVPAGVGAFTFYYAEGASYLSSDPQACVNCHIMRSEFDAWQTASHRAAATCVDCHLPHDFPRKYVGKALNGFNHSKAFTFQDFPEPIRITPRNAAYLQENCLRCHGALAHDLVAGGTRGDGFRCVHCHASVGHGEPVGLGGPDRGEQGERARGRERW